MDMPEPGHHQAGEEAERRLLRRAGIHARRARDHLGAGVEQDRMIGVSEERRAGIVGDRDDQRAGRLRRLRRDERERRRAACRDGDHAVGRAKLQMR